MFIYLFLSIRPHLRKSFWGFGELNLALVTISVCGCRHVVRSQPYLSHPLQFDLEFRATRKGSHKTMTVRML